MTAPVKPVPLVQAASAEERLEKLSSRLKNISAPRPKNKARLLAHINTAFGGKLDEGVQNHLLAELIQRGILTLDAKAKVTYH